MNVKILSLVLIVSVLNAQSQQVTQGTKIQVNQVQKFNNSSTMMGMDMQTDINGTADIEIEIKSVRDSIISLSATTTHFKGSVSIMGQENKFDSNDPTTMNNPMVAPFLVDLNKPKEFVLVNGNIVSNEKSSIDAIASTGLQINLPEIVGQLFVSSTIKNKAEGFKWTAEDKSEDGNQKSISILSISKLKESTIEVTVNNSLSSKGTTKMMGMDVAQNIKGTRASTITYNRVTGILSSVSQNIELKGTAEVMGTALPINTKGTITTKVN